MPTELVPDKEFVSFDNRVFTSWQECLEHERRVQLVMLGMSPDLADMVAANRAVFLNSHYRILSILRWMGVGLPVTRKRRGMVGRRKRPEPPGDAP